MDQKAITAYVLEKDFGTMKAGEVVHMDADEAAPLIESGVLKEAAPEDINGDEPDGDEGLMNESVNRAVSRLSKNLESSIATAMSKVNSKKSTSISVPATTKQPTFKCLGEMLKAAVLSRKGDSKAQRMLESYNDEIRLKAPLGANEGNTAQGGYFLKPTWYQDVWDKIRDYPKLLDRTDRISITGNTFMINEISETGLQDGQRHAGVLGYWVAEAAALTGSFPATAQVTSVLNTNVVFVYATNQLLYDANIESFDKKITELAMLELLWQEDVAVISGTGSNQPLGILNQPSLVTVTKSGLDTNAMFGFDDLANMYGHLYPPSRPNACWLVNPSAYSTLIRQTFVTAANATTTYPAFGGVSYNAADVNFPVRIFGVPVIECLMLPQLGLVGDVILADMKQLICAEHPQVFVDMSEHIAFNTLQTAFRFYRRYDIRSPWVTSLASKDGNFQYSPFVTLSSRGS